MTSTPAQKRTATLQMLVCAVLWSIAGIFIRHIPWNAFAIAGWRSLIAACVVGGYVLISRTPFKITRKSLAIGVFMSLTFLCFVIANKLTTAANAIVLQFTSPVFILLFSVLFFHQKILPRDIVVVCFTIAGISLFFFDELNAGSLAGNCVAITAGITMATMYLITPRATAAERMGGALLGQLFTAAVGVPFTFFTEAPVNAEVVGCLLVLGVVQLGIPYVLYVLSTQHCPALACCLLGAAEPLLNPLWVFLIDGEAPGVFALIGGAIVIAAVTLWSAWPKKAVLNKSRI